MARTPNFTISQREAAQRIQDTEVANVPAVVAARRALQAAEKAYATAIEPRQAAMRRIDELRAERVAVQGRLAEADAQRAVVALQVTDGTLPASRFRELREVIDGYRLELERIDLAIPAIEARYAATGGMTERTANSLADAQAELAAAIKAAKLDRAVAQGA